MQQVNEFYYLGYLTTDDTKKTKFSPTQHAFKKKKNISINKNMIIIWIKKSIKTYSSMWLLIVKRKQ